MKYMGSKSRIIKDILPIILNDRKQNQPYFEPFAGGMNVISEVDGKRIANDKNIHLIEMWKGLVSGKEFPKEISRELYSEARDAYNGRIEHNLTDDYIGWIGWMASYNGRFFDGGYSGHNVGKTNRDYIGEQIRNTLSQVDKLKGVEFHSGEYDEVILTEPTIIYCDIPYLGTKQYATSKNFNYNKFYEWCLRMKEDDHTLFVSEYHMPDYFKCVWQKEIKNTMHQTNTKKPIEKLYTL